MPPPFPASKDADVRPERRKKLGEIDEREEGWVKKKKGKRRRGKEER